MPQLAVNLKQPATELSLVEEYKNAIGEALIQVCSKMIEYGQKFEEVKLQNKAEYKNYKSKDKSVELARLWWRRGECDPQTETVIMPDNLKRLFKSIGFDLGLSLIKKAPKIQDIRLVEELQRLADDPEGLKLKHITRAAKEPEEFEVGELIEMGTDGLGNIIEVTEDTVIAIGHDGAEISEDRGLGHDITKITPPKTGQAVVILDPNNPSVYETVGVLENTGVEQIESDGGKIVSISERICDVAILLGDTVAYVKVGLNYLRKATAKEFSPLELTKLINKLSDRVNNLVDAGAVDITQTPQWQQLELRLEYAEKNSQTSQAERDYIQKIAEENVKKHLVEVEGWVDPITAAELKARADQADTNRLFALENELSTVKTEKESIEQKLNNLEQSYDLTLSELRQVRDRFSGDAEVRVEAQAAKINELNQVIATMSQQLNDFINRPLKDRVQKRHMEPVTSAVRNVMNVLNQQELTAVPA